MELKIIETKLKGVFIIEIEKIEDDRGFFARTWDKKIFDSIGLGSKVVQSSISHNTKKGTIRGLHYQIHPYEETKWISCIKGKIFDVVIDLRQNSSTFKSWINTELSMENHKILYIPEGCAHGFQTLENNSEIYYQMSQFFVPESYRGIRWNDSTFDIKWPLNVTEISKKDKSLPDFES
jgi:dTDP-4-dehydrorhamnose 3,5-epimerase